MLKNFSMQDIIAQLPRLVLNSPGAAPPPIPSAASYLRYALSIRVRSLFAPAREGSPCKDIMRRYETNAAAQAIKVSLSCEDNIADEWIRGPKDYILTVTDWDRERMTQEEAQEKIEGFLDFDIEGNWTIEINDARKYIK